MNNVINFEERRLFKQVKKAQEILKNSPLDLDGAIYDRATIERVLNEVGTDPKDLGIEEIDEPDGVA